MKPKTYILNAAQIAAKLDRLSYEIIEKSGVGVPLHLLSTNANGALLARIIKNKIARIDATKLLTCFDSIESCKEKPIYPSTDLLLIDDVCNTGKTLYQTLVAIDASAYTTIQCAVLIDRKHKNYPIQCDYVGLVLSTTLQDYVYVDMLNMTAWLE